MARNPTNPSARIAQLERALAKAKKLKRGTVLSAKPMAELIGISWPVLRDWTRDVPGFAESNAFTGGGNGINYAFRPAPTIRFLIKHFEAERKAATERAAKVRKVLTSREVDELPADMSLDEIAKLVRVARELREERQRQGQLVDASIVSNAVERMMTRMQQAGLAAAREQDPTGQFEPEIAEKFENAINSVIVQMGQAGRDCLSALRGGAA